MIEAIMYFAIGFFVAVVIGLGLFPLVHNRAVRLTGQRLEAATPLSMAEIQADKDQLRAEFAMSTRRLEMSVEQLKLRTTSQLSELGKKTDAINRLKLELGEKAAALVTMEAREKSLRDQVGATEEELAAKTNDIHEAERTLAERGADIEKLSRELGERTHLTDSQRVEIVALRTQVESLRGQADKLETDFREAQDRFAKERADAEIVSKDLESERGRAQTLGTRVADLERQLHAQANEAQDLGRKVLELENRLSEQGKKLAEREYDVIRLRTEVETVRRTETDLRTDMAAMEDRHNGTSSRLRSEKSVLENELTQVRDERTNLQQEVANLKREAEESWNAERVENALLRERINDIATEVARLTMVLEGPGSPIEAMLAADSQRTEAAVPTNGRKRPAEATGVPTSGSLADRIRALQAHASRIAPPQA